MKKINLKELKINPAIYFTITIIYLEILIKAIITGQAFNNYLIYMIMFSIPFIILFTLLSKSFPKIVNKIITILIALLLTIYFEVQYIFFILFSVPFSFSTIGLANQATDFTNIIKDTIIAHWFHFTLFLIPFIILIIIIKKMDNSQYKKSTRFSLLLMFITSYLSTFLFLLPNRDLTNSASKLYYNIDDQAEIINHFGLLTYTKIDIKRQLLGYDLELTFEEAEPITNSINYDESEPIEYGDNILELDFNKETSNQSIQKLNSYFQNSTASNKSEYTGMFEGKNLIFILAEGFNEIAVDETRTPTLYKLIHSGFEFENFYSPVFLSTTGGEFQATTGLIPTQATLKSWKSNQPTISYALGNAFSNIGYRVQSYHDWTYTYYKRNLTMQTLGFSNYTGCGNGLENRIDCSWLPKDSEMIDATVSDYLNQDGNFVTYYVTVSGHSPYNSGDNIGKLHFDTVAGTEYSDAVKYYLSAQVELDKMLEELIKKLEESGELDDTVIALVGDHYPYTLSTDEVNEVSTYTKDGIIEINHSNFILWNNTMEEKVTVEKVGSQIDVLPTLLNLFGIEYDSRLIIGKDILSNSEGIAIFSNRSWTTDYGTYYSSSRTFVPKEGVTLENEDEYVKRINNKVANYFTISQLIIDNNYYEYILGS